MENERRRTPRYVFFAAAELMEEKSEVRVASRLSELSLRGVLGRRAEISGSAGTLVKRGGDGIVGSQRRSTRDWLGRDFVSRRFLGTFSQPFSLSPFFDVLLIFGQ